MSFRMIAAGAGTLILLCFAPASARPHHGPDPLMRFQDELELSDAQKEELQILRYELRLEEIEFKADLERAQLDLEREMSKSSVDESHILSIFDEVSQARTALEKVHLRQRLGVRKILSADQKEKLLDILEERRPAHRRPRR